jgi:hypothetical protein
MRSTQLDPNRVGSSIVHQRDLAIGDGLGIQCDGPDSTASAGRILHYDVIGRRAVAAGEFVTRPVRRDIGLDPQPVAPPAKAENCLQADAFDSKQTLGREGSGSTPLAAETSGQRCMVEAWDSLAMLR